MDMLVHFISYITANTQVALCSAEVLDVILRLQIWAHVTSGRASDVKHLTIFHKSLLNVATLARGKNTYFISGSHYQEQNWTKYEAN